MSSLCENEDAEVGVAYVHAMLHTLAQVVSKKVEKKDPDVPKYVDRLLPHLLGLFISSVTTDGNQRGVADDARVIGVAAEIITFILQTATAQ